MRVVTSILQTHYAELRDAAILSPGGASSKRDKVQTPPSPFHLVFSLKPILRFIFSDFVNQVVTSQFTVLAWPANIVEVLRRAATLTRPCASYPQSGNSPHAVDRLFPVQERRLTSSEEASEVLSCCPRFEVWTPHGRRLPCTGLCPQTQQDFPPSHCPPCACLTESMAELGFVAKPNRGRSQFIIHIR